MEVISLPLPFFFDLCSTGGASFPSDFSRAGHFHRNSIPAADPFEIPDTCVRIVLCAFDSVFRDGVTTFMALCLRAY